MNNTPRKSATRSPKTSAREFRWIDWIRKVEGTRWRNALVGVGDDAAAWTPTTGHATVATVDTQVDGVHFRSDWFTPRDIGRRSVAASVSDLAAMGAQPRYLLVSLIADKDLTTPRFRALYRGLHDAAAAYSCRIAGGNITGGGPLSLSLTALGECRPERLLERNRARLGNSIWVTGSPGLSGLGLHLLSTERRTVPRGLRSRAIAAYKRPQARVEEGKALAAHWPVTAMVDISDGLVADLRHILEASSRQLGQTLGAVLDPTALRQLPTTSALAARLGKTLAQVLRQPSDDYELCFTTAQDPTPRRIARFRERFGVPISRIGRVVAAQGIRIEGSPLQGGGWEHM